MTTLQKILLVLSLTILALSACKIPVDPELAKNIIQAKSAAYNDVKDAVDTAASGTIVKIPAGDVTWTTTLYIPNDKKIALLGSGINATIIRTPADFSGPLIEMRESGSRVSGIKFMLAHIGVAIEVQGIGWRIDNCTFYNTTLTHTRSIVPSGSISYKSPIGLIDHCSFHNTSVVVWGYPVMMAHDCWAQPLALGTNNAVFIEDCSFVYTIFGNVVDSNYGGRYVFRYNTVVDAYIEAHSVQAYNRASRSWEIYNNTIITNEPRWAPFSLRGGTGVVFNNTITGTWSSGPAIVVDNVRSFSDVGPGIVNGSNLWDGNEDATGYPARDQIGSSTDSWLWTESNPYPPQALDPMYCWNNIHSNSGNTVTVYVHNNCNDHIKPNRDYFNNTTKPGYAPFTYPHPLMYEWK